MADPPQMPTRRGAHGFVEGSLPPKAVERSADRSRTVSPSSTPPQWGTQGRRTWVRQAPGAEGRPAFESDAGNETGR